MKRIFQIGFNKCGTTSLHNFFKSNNISSIHWHNGLLAERIYDNFDNNRSLLDGYEQYQAFTDMVNVNDLVEKEVHVDLFADLYKEFPDSIFIFNDRDPQDWIASRLKHSGGLYAEKAKKRLNTESLNEVKDY